MVVVRHAVYGMMQLMSADLSKLEWWQLLKLLRRYAERDLDQFDAWQFDTASGPLFVQLRQELRADEPAEAFRRIDPGGDYFDGPSQSTVIVLPPMSFVIVQPLGPLHARSTTYF